MPRVYITPPSYAIQNPVERAKTLKKAQTWADAFGWEITVSPLLERYHQSGVWLPAEDRAADLVTALDYDIVWAFRGGYSAVQLVPYLLDMQTTNRPLLIGYSDITVLHACWHVQGWGPTCYGSLAESLTDSRQGESLAAYLRGDPFSISNRSEAAARVLRPGAVEAPIFAACLVVLAGLCGTPAFPDLLGHILAIEDVDERPYAVDFALTQMHLAGKLDGIVGLMAGSFQHNETYGYGGPTTDEILAKWSEILGVPTVVRVPFGHMDDPLVIATGVDVEFEASASGDWSIRWDNGD
ncbi:MAG: LD-carboxypeptidase [Caldilineaceae bacterium]|nr:LD-carboxypeptidase [Caldilineaceae bacterium]